MKKQQSLWQVALVVAICAVATPAVHAHVGLDSPQGGEVLRVGSIYTIQWHVIIQHNTQNWDLEYSLNGTAGPWIPIATDLPVGNPAVGSIHTYPWLVPATPGNQVRVRVRMDNGGADYYGMSNGDLSIVDSLVVNSPTLSLGSGGSQVLTLDAGPALGGLTYVLVGSLAGTSPGLVLDGTFTLPLNPDGYFDYTLLVPNPWPLAGNVGVLDGSGQGTASFTLPPGLNPALAGITASHAYVVIDATPAFVLVSNPSVLTLTP